MGGTNDTKVSEADMRDMEDIEGVVAAGELAVDFSIATDGADATMNLPTVNSTKLSSPPMISHSHSKTPCSLQLYRIATVRSVG